MGRGGRDIDETQGREDTHHDPSELSRSDTSSTPKASRHTPGDKLSQKATGSPEDHRALPSTSRPPNAHERPSDRPPAAIRESHRDRQSKREVYEVRDMKFRLNDAQVDAIRAVGAFRTVPHEALIQNVYNGDRDAFERDLRQLTRQGLVSVSTREGRARERYLSLTREAKHLIDARLKTNPEQRIYAGTLKHRELDHDAALYAMYQKGLERIAEQEGRPTRIVLDYELKESINKGLHEAKALPTAEQLPKLEQIASANDLKVVSDHIPLPDVRIEYETRDGDIAHLDLEYVTPNYHAETIAEKAQAGFTLYGDGGAAGRRVRDEYPSLAAEIISL